MGELQRLEILDLSDNQVEHIPDEICNCVSMTHLTLTQNYLQSLPENIGECTYYLLHRVLTHFPLTHLLLTHLLLTLLLLTNLLLMHLLLTHLLLTHLLLTHLLLTQLDTAFVRYNTVRTEGLLIFHVSWAASSKTDPQKMTSCGFVDIIMIT